MAFGTDANHARQAVGRLPAEPSPRLSLFRTKKSACLSVATAALLVFGGGQPALAAPPQTEHRGIIADRGSADDRPSLAYLHARAANTTVVTSDAHFYGQSPPVYPSPNTSGTGTWADAYGKASALVQDLTLDEIVNLTAGTTSATTGCAGYIAPIARLGFPGLCLQDASNGVRKAEFVSAWPGGVHVGASWNRDLTYQRARFMADEFRKKGINVLLGPVVGPVGRTARNGRNWEGFAVDPYLAGALAATTVLGNSEAGVISSTKHFIGYEQETNRVPQNGVEAVSANIDDRTMHELYLWPFQDAVYAGTGNIMCSYNRVNNSYGCGNSKALNGLLKTELGFQGFVVADWGAQHGGVSTALAGLDMTMPNGGVFWGSNLTEAVQNGSVPFSRVADMATRILAPWFKLGQDKDYPEIGIGLPKDLTQPHSIVDARNSSGDAVLLAGAIEGHVLVKNVRGALPLKKPRFLNLYGYSAKSPDQMNYAPGTYASWIRGLESANASELETAYLGDPSPHPLGIAPNGTIFAGGGSGAPSQMLVRSPFDAVVQQAWADGTALFWDFTTDAPVVATEADACLVFANAWGSEGYDRPGLRDDYTDGLVRWVADRCANTIVVVHNVGVRLVDQWVDHPNVTALIFAHLPGQSSGEALVSLLYGRVSPSGKLPYTVAHNESDYGPNLADPAVPEGQFALFPQADFAEGVFIDYRHFDAHNITPRYEFGFGLSYTAFAYSNLSVQATDAPQAAYPTGAVVSGGPTDLWDELVVVTATVTNTGAVDGAEIAQLYVSLPGGNDAGSGVPVRQLRGFDKPFINSSQSATVSFALTRRDLSIWDVVSQKWLLQNGTYGIAVGPSSRVLPLQDHFVIP